MLPSERPNLSATNEHRRLAVREKDLWLRAGIIQSIRRFFIEQGYLEIETPHLIPAPAPEIHIDAVSTEYGFLHTSPELCMKRLLCAGYDKIFQICKCFRKGERGDLHLPEFTLLEWYRSGIDYVELMDECEEMISFVARELGYGKTIQYGNFGISLKRPWERVSVKEAFKRYSPITMDVALESGSFEDVIVKEIEPKLSMKRPTFLYDYPSSFASLARLKEAEPDLAERFELYIGGLELANAFSELTDSHEQKKRFDGDRHMRRRLGKREYPMPKRFLEALQMMSPSAGIALGVDRLVMLFADTTDIDDVVSFTPEEL